MSSEKQPAGADRGRRRRDVDLLLRRDIALGLAQPRKLPREDPPRR